MADSLPNIYPNKIGDEAYQDFGPLIELYGDPAGALTVYLNGLAGMFKEVDDISSDGANGEPGWSQIFDLVRAKTEWLPWMGQLVGYPVPDKPTDQTLAYYDANQRARITSRSSYKRGTVTMLRTVIQDQLVSPGRVIIHERYSNQAFWIKVWVYSDDITTSEPEVRRAAYSQKVAGLIMDFATLHDENYEMFDAVQFSYQIAFDKFADYQEAFDNPGKL